MKILAGTKGTISTEKVDGKVTEKTRQVDTPVGSITNTVSYSTNIDGLPVEKSKTVICFAALKNWEEWRRNS